MKTGPSRRIRRPGFIFGALFAALILVAMMGCADNSPVAAPTSTLPEQETDGDATDAGTEVEIPDYETDLDLSPEEEEAVDGALEAFVGYIETINRVFSSGGEDVSNTRRFARDDSLKSIEAEAKEMRTDDKYMAGEYKIYSVRVESVEVDKSKPQNNKVSLLFCTKDSEWSVVPEGESLPSSSPKGLTMQHDVTYVEEEWKVANQYLRSKQCNSV